MKMLEPLSFAQILYGDTLRQLNSRIGSDTDTGEVRHEMSVPRSDKTGSSSGRTGAQELMSKSGACMLHPSYLFQGMRHRRKVKPMVN
jgi:hypothetical protein